MGDLLVVDNVSKSFGGVVANHQISLSVAEGKIIGLIGPNGSGKTTLFNSIVGQYPVEQGKIYFNDQKISKCTVSEIARSGLLRTYQQTRVYGQMDCIQNMLISSHYAHSQWWHMLTRFPPEIREEAEDLLEFVGLFEKRFLLAGDLSFGQQKLLEFSMALMNKPKMLLLDEPTAGINPTLINGLIDRLVKVNQQRGITLLVIEHNMRVIMNLAEHIYCLAHGEMLAQGTPYDIQNNSRVIDAYLGVS